MTFAKCLLYVTIGLVLCSAAGPTAGSPNIPVVAGHTNAAPAIQPKTSVLFAPTEPGPTDKPSALSPAAVDCNSLLKLPICPLAFESELVTIINQMRSDSGRAPLTWDYRLFVGARCHSTDMVVNICFTHNDCDGTVWTARYVTQGYSSLRGEILGGGYSTPSQVVNGWKADSLRRQTMLDAASKHIGIGYVHGGTYTHYWTAVFGSATDHVALPCGCCAGLTGNVDCDPLDQTDISDLSALIDNLYITFSPLCCTGEANVDGSTDGNIDISDLSALIDYLYISFTPPAACL